LDKIAKIEQENRVGHQVSQPEQHVVNNAVFVAKKCIEITV
jgi:hypothetical protein